SWLFGTSGESHCGTATDVTFYPPAFKDLCRRTVPAADRCEARKIVLVSLHFGYRFGNEMEPKEDRSNRGRGWPVLRFVGEPPVHDHRHRLARILIEEISIYKAVFLVDMLRHGECLDVVADIGCVAVVEKSEL